MNRADIDSFGSGDHLDFDLPDLFLPISAFDRIDFDPVFPPGCHPYIATDIVDADYSIRGQVIGLVKLTSLSRTLRAQLRALPEGNQQAASDQRQCLDTDFHDFSNLHRWDFSYLIAISCIKSTFLA